MRVERKWRLIHLPWWFKFFADLVKSRPGIRVLAFRVSGCWAFIQFLGFICDSSRHEMHPPFVGWRICARVCGCILLLAGDSEPPSLCFQRPGVRKAFLKQRMGSRNSETADEIMKWNEHETPDLLPQNHQTCFFLSIYHHVFFVFPYRMRLLLAALVPSLLLRVDASKVGDWKLDL